jgi:hypothetical protein
LFNATNNSWEKYKLLKKIATGKNAKSTKDFKYDKLQNELNKKIYQQTADLIRFKKWHEKPTLGSGFRRKGRRGRRR